MYQKKLMFGKVYLLKDCDRCSRKHPNSNFMGTGLALVAVFDEDDNSSIDNLIQKYIVKKALRDEKNKKNKRHSKKNKTRRQGI